MADPVAGGLFSKFLDVSEGLVTRHMSYVFQTKTKINVLKRQFAILDELNTRVEGEVVARSLEGDDGQALILWNDSLKEVKREAEQLLERENTSSYSCSCFFTRCPNPEVRWRLGREAVHITKDIAELLKEKDNHGNIRSLNQVLSKKRDEIFNLLKNSDEQFIGCYGMGGLGKTTLAKEVWRLARGERQTMNNADTSKRTPLGSEIKDEKCFDKAIMIQVSTSPVITKIQHEIAEVLRISLNVSGEMERAVKLDYALKKTEDKVLIIFDDIWDMLDMERVGVPCEKGVLNPKILLTSRTVPALMETGSVVNIQLDELSESESKNLFISIVGKVENERLAEKILEKCGGHPLTISVVAGIVKHKNLHVWEDTVKQLSRINNPDFDKKIYSVFDLSIKNVNEELKNLMLLCGILGENRIPVLNLLMYCMGLHSFNSMDTLDTAWVRLHKLLHDLIDHSLLIGFDETHRCVKIHDMARSSAARLAIETNKTFTPESDKKLDRLPTSILNNVTTISLPYAVDEFPDTLKFPDLDFFLYHSEIGYKEGLYFGSDAPQFSNSLFADCEKLRVLSLRGISTGLPSLANLKNLRTLCLHGCSLKDSGLPDVKELKNLEVLSLRDSELTCLPREVEMLTRLKLLDLHSCRYLEVIPAGLLSKLSKLEHLYMRYSLKFSWNREGSAFLSELESMQLLTCIEIEIEPGVEMPRNMDCNKLQKFYINQGIGYYRDAEDNFTCEILLQSLPQGSSATLLQRADYIHLQGVKCQQKELFGSENFENLTKLFIDRCEGLHHLFSLSMAKKLVKLRDLIIHNSDTIEEIVYIDDARDRINTKSTVNFPKLVKLSLNNLSRLRYFVNISNVSGDCQLPFFGSEVFVSELSWLLLFNLPKLETLFGENLHQDSLSKLQKIDIENCSALVTIFSSAVSLPKLELLWLINIPKLETTWAEKLLPSSLNKLRHITIEGTVFSSSVLLPGLQHLKLSNLPELKPVWSENIQVDTLSKLQSISLEDCSSLVTLFNSNVFLPQLDELRLINLPKVETVWSENTQVNSLSKLKCIFIAECSSLVALFNSDVFLPGLKKLILVELPKLKTVWSENMQANSLSNLKSIYIEDCSSLVILFDVFLPELHILRLFKLPKVETVWSDIMQANSLSKLKSISIEECSSLVTLFNSDVSLPKLELLRLIKLSKLETVWSENIQTDSLRKLKYIFIEDCSSLVTLFNSNVSHLTKFNCSCIIILRLFNSKISLSELKKLGLLKLPKVETVWSEKMQANCLSKLQTISIVDCSLLVTLFNSDVSLPQLEKLIMKNLPKLETLCAKQLLDGTLSKLRILEIKDCYNLKTPFTYTDFESHLESCQLKHLPNLDGLWVEKLINLCRRTLKVGFVVGCGTLPYHISNILEQLNLITDSKEEERGQEEKGEESESVHFDRSARLSSFYYFL